MSAEPPTTRFQMEHQLRRPGYARRSAIAAPPPCMTTDLNSPPTNDTSYPPAFVVNEPPDCTTVDRRATEGARVFVAGVFATLCLYLATSAVRADHSTRFPRITFVGPFAEYVTLLNVLGITISVLALILAIRIYLGRVSVIGTIFCSLAALTGVVNIVGFILFWALNLGD